MILEIRDKIDNSLFCETAEYTLNCEDMGKHTLSTNISIPVKYVNGVESPAVFKTSYCIEFNDDIYFLNSEKPTGVKDNQKENITYTLIFESRRNNLDNVFAKNVAYVYERNADGTANTSNTKLGIEFTTPPSFYGNIYDFVWFIRKNLDYSFGLNNINIKIHNISPDYDIEKLSTSYDKSEHFSLSDIDSTSLFQILVRFNEESKFRFDFEIIGDTYFIVIDKPIAIVTKGNGDEMIFQYGGTTPNGSLLSITRTTDEQIIPNRIYGVGGTDNLPINYFGIKEHIDTSVGSNIEIVSTLPATPDPLKIYLMPNAHHPDAYDKYQYIDGDWDVSEELQERREPYPKYISYYNNLMPECFRDYLTGWNIGNSGMQYNPPLPPFSDEYWIGYADGRATLLGVETYKPINYYQDNEAIAKYGVRDLKKDFTEIVPSIISQYASDNGVRLGRLDEIIDVYVPPTGKYWEDTANIVIENGIKSHNILGMHIPADAITQYLNHNYYILPTTPQASFLSAETSFLVSDITDSNNRAYDIAIKTDNLDICFYTDNIYKGLYQLFCKIEVFKDGIQQGTTFTTGFIKKSIKVGWKFFSGGWHYIYDYSGSTTLFENAYNKVEKNGSSWDYYKKDLGINATWQLVESNVSLSKNTSERVEEIQRIDKDFKIIENGTYKVRLTYSLTINGYDSNSYYDNQNSKAYMNWCSVSCRLYESSFDYDTKSFFIWTKNLFFNPMSPRFRGEEGDVYFTFQNGKLAGNKFAINPTHSPLQEMGVYERTDKLLTTNDEDGSVLTNVPSKYCIELKHIVNNINSTENQQFLFPQIPMDTLVPAPKDLFIIEGVRYPYEPYVLSAEKKVGEKLKEELVKEARYSYSIALDHISINKLGIDYTELKSGNKIKLRNNSLAGTNNSNYAELTIKSVNITKGKEQQLDRYVINVSNIEYKRSVRPPSRPDTTFDRDVIDINRDIVSVNRDLSRVRETANSNNLVTSTLNRRVGNIPTGTDIGTILGDVNPLRSIFGSSKSLESDVDLNRDKIILSAKKINTKNKRLATLVDEKDKSLLSFFADTKEEPISVTPKIDIDGNKLILTEQQVVFDYNKTTFYELEAQEIDLDLTDVQYIYAVCDTDTSNGTLIAYNDLQPFEEDTKRKYLVGYVNPVLDETPTIEYAYLGDKKLGSGTISIPPIPVNSEDRYKYINHRLGRKPDVQLIDESGEIRYVQVIHLSDDSLQLSWVGSIVGSIIIE